MAKAKTLRFAYQDPALQQFPPEARHIFIAKPGHIFLSVDYRQVEARLLAYFSEDKAAIKVFNEGGDCHTENAKDLFAESTITKAQRYYSKSFLYRITYGGQGSDKEKTYCPCAQWGCDKKLPDTLSLTKADKLAAESRWFAKHSAVQLYQNRLYSEITKTGFYDHPLGSRRHFATPYGAELRREVMNEPMQRGGALLMARAQITLDSHLAPIILQMHDEFLLEIPESDLAWWGEEVQEVMERPILELGGVQFPTDVEWGYNWGSQTPENPRGMREYQP